LINQEIVWETVEKHVPALKAEVERIIEALPGVDCTTSPVA